MSRPYPGQAASRPLDRSSDSASAWRPLPVSLTARPPAIGTTSLLGDPGQQLGTEPTGEVRDGLCPVQTSAYDRSTARRRHHADAEEVGQASGASILGLVHLGVFPTAIAFTTWAYALPVPRPANSVQRRNLVPVVAAGMSWILLDEVPPALSFMGGALCLIGVALTRLRPARSSKS